MLRPGGRVVFTDPMAAEDADKSALAPILVAPAPRSLGSPGFYRDEFPARTGSTSTFEDHTQQLTTHYGRVLSELSTEQEWRRRVSDDYMSNMKIGLRQLGRRRRPETSAWGIFRIGS